MKQVFAAAVLLLATSTVSAHVTPPRILLKDADAVRLLMPEAANFTRSDIKPTKDQKQQCHKMTRWTPDQASYKVFVGKDATGREIGRVMFMGDITIHGVVQMAVAMTPENKVKGVAVVAITDEAYGWVKPLVEKNFAAQFVGKAPTDTYIDGEKVVARRGSMEKFYGQVLASLIQRSAVLCHMMGKAA
jgi:hypothetical protein